MEQIRLDLIPDGSMPVCHASQYDDGRVIRVNLTENGADYTLSDEVITLDVRKGDGCAVTSAIAFESGKKYVDIVTTEQMCAVAGSNLAELKITKNGAIIGTLNFILQVERDPLDEGINSSSEIHDLQAQVDRDVLRAFSTIGAEGLPYDNTESGLTAENVQAAIDEVNAKIEQTPADVYTKSETDALLDAKADKSTTYTKTETDALLDDKADVSALGDYATKSEVNTALSGKADKSDVYTKSQTNSLLAGKVDNDALEDYYTKTETDSLLAGKANKNSVYTKSQTDSALALKANADDVYDKTYINGALGDINTALGQKANSADVYSKSYIDTALSAKANANAVYTKAETDAKVEALIDDDTTASNKAWSSQKITDELIALLPVDSASGSIASFSTSLALPLVSLKASIVATESGSGTKSPTNPYTLGGFSNAVITRAGKNLFNLDVADKKWVNSSNVIINGVEGTKSNVIPCNAGTTITISSQNALGSNNFLLIATLDTNGNVTSRSTKTSGTPASLTKTASAGDVAFLVSFYDYSLTGGGMVEAGSTASATYEAYNPNSTQTTIALGQTVYGGEIVLTKKASGYGVKLRVTKKGYDLGDLSFVYNATKQWFSVSGFASTENLKLPTSASTKTNGSCEIYEAETQNNLTNDLTIDNSFGLFSSGALIIRDLAYTDATQFATARSGKKIMFELATPIEIDLTDASDIVALVGVNNVWSDTGDVEVRFKVGIQEYIDSKVGNNRSLSLSMSAPADDLRREEPDVSEER